MKELFTIHNRGYTTAFHNGRLTDLAHNYDITKTLSDFSFVGIIKKYENNQLIMELRGMLECGDVLEFISPFIKEPIRLRLYTFVDYESNKEKNKISPGKANQCIKIPLDIFSENIDIEELLPPYSVVRKPLIIDEKYALFHKRNLQEFAIEHKNNEQNQAILNLTNKKIAQLPQENTPIPKILTRTESCCLKGCNGCLIFWHEDKYQVLRDKIKSKPLGEKLINNVDFSIEEYR